LGIFPEIGNPQKELLSCTFRLWNRDWEIPALREFHCVLKNGGNFCGFEDFKKTGK
jgi:hypothetical protein